MVVLRESGGAFMSNINYMKKLKETMIKGEVTW